MDYIIPVDHSLHCKAAVVQMIAWLKPGDSVTLVHMISDLMPTDFEDMVRCIYTPQNPIEEEGRTLLEDLRDLFPLDIPVAIALLEGYCRQGLPAFLEKREEDFVVIGSQGLGSVVSALLLGSVGKRILRRTQKPLLVITKKETRRDQMKHILIPIDGSPASLRAVDQGRILQEHFQAEVTLLYVLPDPRKEGVGEGAMAVRRQMDASAAKARPMLSAAAERLSDISVVRTEWREGLVKREIEKMADSGHYDLIIMGTEGMGSALKRFLLGSVTKYILEHVEVPVLVVR